MPGVLDSIQLIDGDVLARRVTMPAAVRGIQRLVRDGFDPDHDPARAIVDVCTLTTESTP